MGDRKPGGIFVNISKTLETALANAEAAKAKAAKAEAAKAVKLAEVSKKVMTAALVEEASNVPYDMVFTEEQKLFMGVIAGEALEANEKTWKAVAHTIMNRLKEPRDRWSNVETVTDVLDKTQYDAVEKKQYLLMREYLENRDGSAARYESLIAAVLPIYAGSEPDFTGGAHYIFNIKGSESLEADLNAQPDRYVRIAPIDGINNDDFRMYRCLW